MNDIIKHTNIEADGVRFHVAIAGEGPAVYLLHGWPQTGRAWERIMPALAERYTVVAPDQRGIGFTSKPESGYDAHTLGDDVAAIARALGHEDIAVVGHDWGATPAYSVAARHRDLVRSLTILDSLVAGTKELRDWMVPQAGGNFMWHQGFFSVPVIPEMLLAGNERKIIDWIFTAYVADPTAVSGEEIDFYERMMKLPGALRAGLEWYKAWFKSADQCDELAKQKLDIPVLALGAEAACGTLTFESMKKYATNVQGGVVERCGHFMIEEHPDHMTELLLAFFDETTTESNARAVLDQ